MHFDLLILNTHPPQIKNLQGMATRNSGAATAAIEELRLARTKIDGLSSRINELEASYNAANVCRLFKYIHVPLKFYH